MKEENARLDSLIINCLNFNNIAQNLLNTTDDRFESFFEKLYNMDKRSPFLFIRENKDRILKTQIEFAKKYYEHRGRYLKWDD